MDDKIAALKRLYTGFNARNIDGVLAGLAGDVAWANGMDGGHVHGLDGVREYWTRQWAVVSPLVEPVSFTEAPDGSVRVEVKQTIRDLEGRPLEGPQEHGLRDKLVGHVFRFEGDKVSRFDIAEV